MSTIPNTGKLSFGASAGSGRSINLFKGEIDNTTTDKTKFSLSAVSTYMQNNSAVNHILLPNMSAGPVYSLGEFRNASYSKVLYNFISYNQYVGESSGNITYANTFTLSSLSANRYALVGGGGYGFNCQNGAQSLSLYATVTFPNNSATFYSHTMASGTYDIVVLRNDGDKLMASFGSLCASLFINQPFAYNYLPKYTGSGIKALDTTKLYGNFTEIKSIQIIYSLTQSKGGPCYGGMSMGQDVVYVS